MNGVGVETFHHIEGVSQLILGIKWNREWVHTTFILEIFSQLRVIFIVLYGRMVKLEDLGDSQITKVIKNNNSQLR